MDGPFKPLPPIELAPLVNTFPGGGVFQGAGNSHFTFANNQFHVTTEIPGLKQGVPIVDHLAIDPKKLW